MDRLDYVLEQHAHSHAAALTGAAEPMLSDQVLAGPGEEQLRLRPAPGLNSIAWLLWHIARSEDVMVGVLLTAVVAISTWVGTSGRDGVPWWVLAGLTAAYVVAMVVWTVRLLRAYRPPGPG